MFIIIMIIIYKCFELNKNINVIIRFVKILKYILKSFSASNF